MSSTPTPPFKVKQFIDPDQLKSDLAFTTNDISSAMSQHASLFAHYGVEAAKSAAQVDRLKLLLENTEAAIYRLEREEAIARSEKVTEAYLEKLVTRNPRTIAMKSALNEARQIEAIAKIAVESFRQRKDMLVQHGAQQREEYKGELKMMDMSIADRNSETLRAAAIERFKERNNQ